MGRLNYSLLTQNLP